METSQLDYYLPPELIAQTPADERTDSRLLVLGRNDGSITDSSFVKVADYFGPGDCLVINDTKVLPARFFAVRKTGARIQGLFLEQQDGMWQVLLKNAQRIKPGEQICLLDRAGADYCTVIAAERQEKGHWRLKVDSQDSPEAILEKTGFTPLPPYIKRPRPQLTHELDSSRYQTVYAATAGAVAAPTAGLHFTEELLDKLKNKGLSIAHLTLAVGAGTFKPVTAKRLQEHEIHSESFSLDEKNAAIINQARQNRGRIIAVGTTSVRTLETIAAAKGQITAMQGSTNLFIMPGFEFRAVDAMITNFHLPKSTLLALIGAFAGLERVKAAYQHAIRQRYRFYSYGDAMLIA